MSKSTIKTFVPKLRFPEFRDAGEWTNKPLGEVLSYEQPTRYLVENAKYSDEYETPVLTAGKTFLLGYTNETKGIFKDNLPTIIFDDFTTAFQFVDFPFKAKSSAMKMLIPATSETNMKFSFEAMKTVKFFPSTHKRYWISEYQNIEAPFPSRNEQQKIADCLSSIDELITAHSQKHETLKAHKKGLMQQLFPAEGETVPKLRFTEFKDDWVQKKGEEITFKITKGSSPSWQGFSYQSEGILFVTSENVRNGFLDVSSPKYLPKKFYEKQKNSQLSYGDILINIVGASIGRNCLFLLECEAFTNQAVALFRVDNKNSFEFISYCYQHDKIQKAVFGSQSESARPNLSLTDLKNMKFSLPSLTEQQKIADYLSSIDDLITAQSQKIETLKAHKKGLMQQLFPSTNEVNG